MIEKLVNLRVLVYERKFNETSKTFEWDLRKRFYDYPHELSDKSQSMYLFSPNLRKFIDYNIELQAFVLKDTLEPSEKKLIIPLDTGSCKEDISDAVRRFRWINDYKILVSSRWGFEKLYQFSDDYSSIQEISSSQILAFGELAKSPQIYFEPDSLGVWDVKRRLLRKHQELKRLRFICDKEDAVLMY